MEINQTPGFSIGLCRRRGHENLKSKQGVWFDFLETAFLSIPTVVIIVIIKTITNNRRTEEVFLLRVSRTKRSSENSNNYNNNNAD